MNKEILTRPFTDNEIKWRDGKAGDIYEYVSAEDVIARLNEATEDWNVIIKEYKILAEEVVVLVSLTIEGKTKESFGKGVIRAGNSIADILKIAEGNAITYIASMFGVPCRFDSCKKSNAPKRYWDFIKKTTGQSQNVHQQFDEQRQKEQRPQQPNNQQQNQQSNGQAVCKDCGKALDSKVAKYSTDFYGMPLCIEHQKKHQKIK